MSNTVGVLLVEDSPDDALIIREMLSESSMTHYRVEWEISLSAGLRYLKDRPGTVDVVLLDLGLPDSQGMESLYRVKKGSPDTPIVVLTGLGHEELGRLAIREGAQDYICKNEIGIDVLENSLRFAFERNLLLVQLEEKRRRLIAGEQRLRHIIEKNVDGIFIVDRQGNLKYVNPTAENLIGGNHGELLGRLFQNGHTHELKDSLEIELLDKKGNLIVAEVRVVEIDWQGKSAFLASLRDITARKELERSLTIEKERLDITLRSIADGVITAGHDGRITLLNKVAEQITGLTSRKAYGRFITRLLGIDGSLEETTAEGKAFGTAFIKPAGSEDQAVIEYSGAVIRDKEDRLLGFVFIIRDITLRQQLAEEMTRVRKLESLGVIAGRLAHEYDNVFTVILGNISIAKKHPEAGEDLPQMLEKAEKSALKARELTDQLHTFSKSRDTAHKGGSIVKLTEEVAHELCGEGSGIQCNWNIDGDLRPVEFDKDQMYTALWNIFKNAAEAMPGGGALDIRLQNAEVSEQNYPHLLLQLEEGSFIEIRVTDQGHGIDKELMKKIFDPFFTTRENSPGMGLPTAFSIVRKHGGTIDVESQIDKGAAFTLFLPAPAGREEE